MKMAAAILIILFLATTTTLVYSDFNQICPDEFSLNPCKCQQVKTGVGVLINVTCISDDIKAIYRSVDIISKSGTKVFQINIVNNVVTELRNKLFGDSIITQINLVLPRLKKLQENMFLGQQNSLHKLDFTATDMNFIPLNVVQHVELLDSFTFANSRGVMEVGSKAFQEIPWRNTLMILNYSRNKIITIHEKAFSDLIRLVDLDLSNNHIITIKGDILPTTLSGAINLLLTKNNLKKIPADVLQKMPDYSSVYMASNNIKDVEESVLKMMIRKVLPIHLEGNPLNCSCSFQAISIAISSGLSAEMMHGTCIQPMKLHNRSLASLNPTDFIHCN